MRLLLACILLTGLGLGQSVPTSVQKTTINNIASSATVIDNRSQFLRANDYHGFSVTASGTWSVQLQYSDTSAVGPWTNFPEQAAAITQLTVPPIGSGAGYHAFLRFSITGSVSINYSGTKGLFIASSGSGVGGSGVVSLAGTANQVTVSTPTGTITLSIPTNPILPGTTTGTFSGNLTGNVTGTASANELPLTFSSPLVRTTNTITLPSIAESVVTNLVSDLAAKAPIASPTFTGTATGTFSGNITGTASGNELPLTFSSPLVRTTNAISLPSIAESVVTNLVSDLALKAPLASPAFTGTATVVNATCSGTCTGFGVGTGTVTNPNGGLVQDTILTGVNGGVGAQTANTNVKVTPSTGDVTTPGGYSSGVASGKSGAWFANGATSGTAGWGVPAVAGTAILYLLPSTAGTAGQVLVDNGVVTCPALQTGAPALCHQMVWSSSSAGSTYVDYQKQTTLLSLSGTDQTIYTTTVTGGTIGAGHCLIVDFQFQLSSGSVTNYKLTYGATSYIVYNGTSNTDLWSVTGATICNNPGVTNAQQISAPQALTQSTLPLNGGTATAAEDSTASVVLKLTVTSGAITITGMRWHVTHD